MVVGRGLRRAPRRGEWHGGLAHQEFFFFIAQTGRSSMVGRRPHRCLADGWVERRDGQTHEFIAQVRQPLPLMLPLMLLLLLWGSRGAAFSCVAISLSGHCGSRRLVVRRRRLS